MKKLILILFILAALLVTACKPKDNHSSSSSVKSTSTQASSSIESSFGGKSSSTQKSQSLSSKPSSSSSQASKSDEGNIVDPSTKNFAEKTDEYLNSATIVDSAFINYYKSLDSYKNNAKVVNNAIYASPSGNGDGTINEPYSLQDALDSVKEGQTIYLRGGTYSAPTYEGFYIEFKGSSSSYITIRNYPGESVKITNPNQSGQEAYAFQISENACYFVMEGLEISNVQANNAYAIVAWGNGQNHFILRNLKIHDIKTTSKNPNQDDNCSANAMLLSGEKQNAISNVIIAENQCYNNVTGWAESISVAANCEYVYVLENEVHDMTNIGIDFYGNAGYCDVPSLDQPRFCVAAGNTIYNGGCSYADCAGLYVDGARDTILQYNTVYNCQYGIEVGSEERNDSYPVKNIIVRNNIFENNSVCGIRVGGYEEVKTGVVQSTTFENNTLNSNGSADGAEIIIAKVNGIKFLNNAINALGSVPIVTTDFDDSLVKNVTFNGNTFSSQNGRYTFKMYLDTQNSLAEFNKLVGNNVSK